MLRRAPSRGARKRRTGVNQASVQKRAAQPDRNQPRAAAPRSYLQPQAKKAVYGGGQKNGVPHQAPTFSPPGVTRQTLGPAQPAPQRNVGPQPYAGPSPANSVAGVMVHNTVPGWSGQGPLPVGWAEVADGTYVQNWNGLTPEQRTAIAASANPYLNDAAKARVGGVQLGQQGYTGTVQPATVQPPAPPQFPIANGMNPLQTGGQPTLGAPPLNFTRPDLNPVGAGQYQGPGGGMGMTQEQLNQAYAQAQAQGPEAVAAFMAQHPRFADQTGFGLGVQAPRAGEMPAQPGLQMPGGARGTTPGTPPREFAAQAAPIPTNLSMPGTGARGATPGTPNRVYMPPTQTGNSTGGGGGQNQPNSNANPIEMNPHYVQGLAMLDDELARTLTELGVSEADLNASIDLIKSRLNVGHQEDRRLTNETMNARGLFDSGIRNTGLGKVDYDYGTRYQDADLQRLSGLREIANARSAAHSNKKKGLAGLVLDIAGNMAADPGFDVSSNYSGPTESNATRDRAPGAARKRARRGNKRKRKNRG